MSDPSGADAEKSHPKFWWFEGESVREIARRLNVDGVQRLEVRIDHEDHMTMRVIGPSLPQAEETDVNFSHVCPPICP